MHPDYISDRPGECPICGMDLVPMEQEGTGKGEQGAEVQGHNHGSDPESRIPNSEQQYYCPMHPDYITDKPGDCPICGMDLIPLESGNGEQGTGNSETSKLASHASFKVKGDIAQLIGVAVSEVIKRDLVLSVLTYGRVAFDPALYTAIDEYIETQKSYQKLKNSEFEEVKSNAKNMVDRAKVKLKLMGLSKEQIAKIGSGSVSPENLLFSENKAWIYAEVYEYESGVIRKGQNVRVTSKAFPGKLFTGKVASMDPVLSGAARTLKIRAEVENKGKLLKPEMFVNVLVEVPVGNKISIPKSAVVTTGLRNIVFKQVHEGYYTPVEVTLGQATGRYYEVLEGVAEGEQVVESGNFLLDSESRIKATFKKGMGNTHSGTSGEQGTEKTEVTGHNH